MQLRTIENNIKKIKILSEKHLQNNIWPMSIDCLKELTVETILSLQEFIAILRKEKKIKQAQQLINEYSFNFVIRMYAIFKLSDKDLQNMFGLDFIFDEKLRLEVLIDSRYENIQTQKYLDIIKIKKDIHSRVYSLHFKLVNIILQKSLVILIEPFYEASYHEEVYGFRPGRSPVQAVGHIYKNLIRSQDNKTVLDIDVEGCLNSKTLIPLKKIWVPDKYRNFVDIWLEYWVVFSEKQGCSFNYAGASQNVIGSLFLNILLNDLKAFVFQGVPKKIKNPFLKYKQHVITHCITYVNNIILISNYGNSLDIKNKVNSYLNEIDIVVPAENIKILSFNSDIVINWQLLGFSLDFIPTKKIRKYYSFMYSESTLSAKEILPEPYQILIFPSSRILTNYTDILKSIICSGYNLSVSQLIHKLNPIIKDYCRNYNFFLSKRLIEKLDLFLFKLLVEWSKKKSKNELSSSIMKEYFDINSVMDFDTSYSGIREFLSNPDPKLVYHRQILISTLVDTLIPSKLRSHSFFTHRKAYDSLNFRKKITWRKK